MALLRNGGDGEARPSQDYAHLSGVGGNGVEHGLTAGVEPPPSAAPGRSWLRDSLDAGTVFLFFGGWILVAVVAFT